MISKCPLILIDEPEAFLHTPQIRALAKIIARETSAETQVIISTHSHDLVQGLIDFGERRVTVARLSRQNLDQAEINNVTKLNSADIADLWQDPLLRTSDVLTSLFHHVALIVEGDSDARFYRSMMEAISNDAASNDLNIKYINCNGKDKIPKIARSLKAIGVPVVCVVDIDVLDDLAKFLLLVKSFEGDVAIFERHVVDILRFVAEHRSVGTAAEAKEELDAIFGSLDGKKPIPKDFVGKINDAVRSASAWSLVKRSGETFFTRGEPFNAFQSVAKSSAQLGILINKHGELENMCREVVARKSEWLNAVLQKGLKTDPNLQDARDFAEETFSLCKQIAGLGA